LTDGKLAIGLIRTSYGLKGELKVKSLSGEIGHFMKLKEICLKGRRLPPGKQQEDRLPLYKVEYVRKHRDSILIKLAGIDTPEQGKSLSGYEIWVDRQYANPKDEDEYYHADLRYCTVLLDNREFGKIKSIIEGPQYELLEVQSRAGKTVLIPFTEEYVGTVDVEQKQVLKEAVKQL
jgi:16S rRNA processing protein RimM